MAQSIFEIMDDLTVSREDILEAELFAEQYLSAQFPTYDFRQGTALRDMTVRPNATLLALVNKAIRHYFDQTDINNITDDTDQDVVDSRFSNFFLERQSGNNAVVRARLYFSFPTATPVTVTIPSTAYFSPDNTIKYYPSSTVIVNPPETVEDPSKYYFRYDNGRDQHFVDLSLTSESPTDDANLEEGDLLYFTVFSPYFISGTIQYLETIAIETETNSQLVERAYTSISTRNLINSPSIISRITDQFNFVNQVLPVGLGDPLMYRDLVDIDDPNSPGTTRTFHRGGMTDIYVDAPLVTQKVRLVADSEGKVFIQGPVVSARLAETEGEDFATPIDADYSYQVIGGSEYDSNGVPLTPANDIGMSARQVTEITILNANPGDVSTWDVTTFIGINSIEDAISSKEQRVVVADYLARGFEPVFIDISAQVRVSGQDIEAATEALQAYILDKGYGTTLTVSEIISVIQTNGVPDIVMPIDIKAIIKNRSVKYDTLNPAISDETEVDVLDIFSLRENQMFYPRTIEFYEE